MSMDKLVLLLPVIFLELAVMIAGVIGVSKRTKFKYFNKFIWLGIVIFVQILGPVLFFTLERED